MFHGRNVPQGSQDLKWLPPESNALLYQADDKGVGPFPYVQRRKAYLSSSVTPLPKSNRLMNRTKVVWEQPV
jgi:hypothetical protein